MSSKLVQLNIICSHGCHPCQDVMKHLWWSARHANLVADSERLGCLLIKILLFKPFSPRIKQLILYTDCHTYCFKLLERIWWHARTISLSWWFPNIHITFWFCKEKLHVDHCNANKTISYCSLYNKQSHSILVVSAHYSGLTEL